MPNAYAHSSDSFPPSWGQWGLDVPIILIIVSLGVIYYFGIKGIVQKKVYYRNQITRSASCYYLGLIVLLVALISPIDTMSDVLAWAHMLQHTLILMVAAPLMVLGAPHFIGLWSMPSNQWRSLNTLKKYFKVMMSFKNPIIVWVIYSIILLIWHIPKFYEAALKNELLHDFQHLSFFIAAYFFWRIIFDPIRKSLTGVLAILYPFVASLHGIILGVFMTLSPKVWYESYVLTAPQYGFSALEDQQISGLIMWMPAGLSYALASLYIIHTLLNQSPTIQTNNAR